MAVRDAQPDILMQLVNGELTPGSTTQIKDVLTYLGVNSDDLDDEFDKVIGMKPLTEETATTLLDDLETTLLTTAVTNGDKPTMTNILANKGAVLPNVNLGRYPNEGSQDSGSGEVR